MGHSQQHAARRCQRCTAQMHSQAGVPQFAVSLETVLRCGASRTAHTSTLQMLHDSSKLVLFCLFVSVCGLVIGGTRFSLQHNIYRYRAWPRCPFLIDRGLRQGRRWQARPLSWPICKSDWSSQTFFSLHPALGCESGLARGILSHTNNQRRTCLA